MGSAADRQAGGVDPDAALLDVTGMTFDALLAERNALACALQRVTRETTSDEEFYAAFGNFAPGNPGPPAVAPHDA